MLKIFWRLPLSFWNKPSHAALQASSVWISAPTYSLPLHLPAMLQQQGTICTYLTHEMFLSVLHLALNVPLSTWQILSPLPKFRFICFPFQTPFLNQKLTHSCTLLRSLLQASMPHALCCLHFIYFHVSSPAGWVSLWRQEFSLFHLCFPRMNEAQVQGA